MRHSRKFLVRRTPLVVGAQMMQRHLSDKGHKPILMHIFFNQLDENMSVNSIEEVADSIPGLQGAAEFMVSFGLLSGHEP